MKASPQNLALLGLMERGQAASARNDADRYTEHQTRMLETLTKPVPVVKAPGMPEPPDDACLEHLGSRLIAAPGGLLVGSHCSCVCELVTVAGRTVRSVLRREAT